MASSKHAAPFPHWTTRLCGAFIGVTLYTVRRSHGQRACPCGLRDGVTFRVSGYVARILMDQAVCVVSVAAAPGCCPHDGNATERDCSGAEWENGHT